MVQELTKAEQEKIFNEEFLPHIESVYNFAFYLTNDEEDAKDLLQESFLKAYKYAGYYQEGTNAKAWLLKILKNTFINEYRKKSTKPRQLDYDNIEGREVSEDMGIVDLRHEVFKEMIGDEITKAINELPADYRLIILLCDLEGFKYEEIAKIVDVPVGTVRSRLHRARNLLKEKLADYAKKKGF
ncbi:MAG: sigma-70 family RNA polymerase sigma factor [Bacteroidia bacterium]